MKLFNISSKGVILGDRLASVDLGTLNWVKYTDFFAADISDKIVGEAKKSPLRCGAYETYLGHRDNMPDKSIAGNADWPTIYIKDSDCSDFTVAQFASAVSGVTVEYAVNDTSSFQRAEFNYPAYFHKDTKLPATIEYNPAWWSGQQFLLNNARSTSIPLGIKKVGTHVYIQGSLNGCRVVGDTTDIFLMLPEPIRPTYPHFVYAPSTTAARSGTFCFYPNGRVELYNTTTPCNQSNTGGNTTRRNTGTWRYDICTDYFTDNNEPMTPANMTTRNYSILYNQGLVGYRRIGGNNLLSLLNGTTQNMRDASIASTYIQIDNVEGVTSIARGYLCIDGPVYVPMGTTSLKMEINHTGSTGSGCRFSMFLIDGDETAASINNSGRVVSFSGSYVNSSSSAYFDLAGVAAGWNTYTYTIPSNFDFNRPVYVGAAMSTVAADYSYQRGIRCRKIWFE